MKLDKKLNLVIPVYDENDKPLYVHSMPISRETFETYFRVLSRAFTEIYTGGFGTTAGPRMAATLIRDIAKSEGVWEGVGGVDHGLMSEIKRLTNVLVQGPNGWDMLPLTDALNNELISEEDFFEVENSLCFFIVNSAMLRKSELAKFLDAGLRLWGAQTTLLDCTAYLNSLPTSTKADNTGEKVGSVPSNQLDIPS